MKSLILACCLQAATFSSAAASQTIETVMYHYPWGVDHVSFNPTQITKTELDSWMRLSPHLSPYNDLSGLIDIRRCLPDDKEYVGCGTDAKLRINNVDVNIQKIRDLKNSLEVQKVPPGLKTVVDYLEEIQTFSLWRTQRQREFLLERDISILRDRYHDIPSTQRCASILKQIAQLARDKDPTNLVVVEWGNCVWELEAERIGPYPKKDWEAFLASKGIKEENIEEVPDN